MISFLGGSILTLVPSQVGKIVPMADPETEWKWAVDGIKECASHAKAVGVTISLEPLCRFKTNFLNRHDQALKLREDVGCDNVGVALDIFHMNIEEDDPMRALRNTGKHLVDVHVADNNRRPPGEGSYDWQEVIDTLKSFGYDGYLTVEFIVPVDRSPLAIKQADIATEALEAGLKSVREHGSDLMSDAEYSRHVKNAIVHLRSCGA